MDIEKVEEKKKRKKRKRTCGHICLNSKGNICHCICRGKNHGKSLPKQKNLLLDDYKI